MQRRIVAEISVAKVQYVGHFVCGPADDVVAAAAVEVVVYLKHPHQCLESVVALAVVYAPAADVVAAESAADDDDDAVAVASAFAVAFAV